MGANSLPNKEYNNIKRKKLPKKSEKNGSLQTLEAKAGKVYIEVLKYDTQREKTSTVTETHARADPSNCYTFRKPR